MSEPLQQLTAAILVGGQGTRLRPVTGDGQKVLAPVAGRAFLFWILDQLVHAGLRRVVLCTGHKATEVMATVGNQYGQMVVEYSEEPNLLGTAGALRRALALLKSDPVLVLNGDSYCEVDFAAFYQSHLERQAAGSLVVRQVDDTSQSGQVCFDEQGRITRFAEKAPNGGPGWISVGIYLLSQRVLASIPGGRAVSIERETFPAWVGHGLFAFPTRGKFLDIGTPASYDKAQEFFR